MFASKMNMAQQSLEGRPGTVALPMITPTLAANPPPLPPTPRRAPLVGRFRYHHDFPSTHLGNKRTLIVYLPPGYETRPERRYPVLYLHDGQNIFDPATSFTGVSWAANETAERLILTRRIRPIIMVGVYNTPDRIQEYTTHVDPKLQGGRGQLYGRFLFEEVKPFIDLNYRTLPGRRHTGLAGSSLGGQISLALAQLHHNQFHYCAALSPSLWWARGALLRDLDGSPGWLRRMRFWIDMGTKEGKLRGEVPYGISRTRKLIEHFDKAGLLPGHDYVYWEVTGGEHSEVHWARRFDKVLLYFFGRRRAPAKRKKPAG
jgi:predicted alpha/beta superfamily hydrolase